MCESRTGGQLCRSLLVGGTILWMLFLDIVFGGREGRTSRSRACKVVRERLSLGQIADVDYGLGFDDGTM